MTRTDLPDDVITAMRAAADAAPPHHRDLDFVRRRGRARRRRRTATVAGVAALAVAAAIAVPSVLSGQVAGPANRPPVADPPVLPVPPAAAETPAEPAQRLLLDGAGWVAVPTGDGEDITGAESGETAREAYERLREVPGAVGVLGELAELRPDGEVVGFDLHALPGIDSVNGVAATPDGRLVAIGVVDRMPGVERQDGPCVKGVDFPLLVIEADGTVSLSREVRVMCETLTLLGADAGTAYLVRGDSRLVAHDLATGDERVLVESPDLVYATARGSVAAGRVAMLASESGGTACPADGPAVARVVEFDTGATTVHPLPPGACATNAGPMRLSPDGRYLAVAFHHWLDVRSELRVAILDLATDELVTDRLIVGGDVERLAVDTSPRSVATVHGAVAGIAWDDEQTLRVAWYEMPAEGVHWLADAVEVSTFSVA